MQPPRTHILLRRINNTLRVSLPIEFVRRNRLSVGDSVVWTEEDGSVRLKFLKLTKIEELAEETASAA
jgi:hypothetical protein